MRASDRDEIEDMKIWGQVLKYHFLLTAAFPITLLTVV